MARKPSTKAAAALAAVTAAPAAAEQLATQPVAPTQSAASAPATPPASTEQPMGEAPGSDAGSSGQDAQPITDQAAADAAATTSQPASTAHEVPASDAAGAGESLPYPSGVEPSADPLAVALSELQGGDMSKTNDESEATAVLSTGGTATGTVDDLELDDDEVEGLWIVAIPEQGFRRCGYRFTREGFGIALSALTPEQIEALENEPNLKVERGIFSGRLDQLVQ